MKQKVYRFPKPPRIDDFPMNRIQKLSDDVEELSGEVDGVPASDIEERFARALIKAGLPFEFRKPVLAPRNMPGSYEIDFLVYKDGLEYPVQIDGEYAHKSAEQRAKDQLKDMVLNNAKRGEFEPVTRVEYTKLDTQEVADNTVEEMFL